jgi:hypothetical protein
MHEHRKLHDTDLFELDGDITPNMLHLVQAMTPHVDRLRPSNGLDRFSPLASA